MPAAKPPGDGLGLQTLGPGELGGHCFLCATEPDEFAWPPPADGAGWFAVGAVMPVAAALRACGRWSLQDTARRFDAQDWWYRLRFEAPEFDAGTPMVLGLDGLATLAQVWLNGQSLLESDNMFVAHACDVTPLLQLGVNELVMVFRAMDQQLGRRRARPRWRTPMVAHQQLRWFRSTLLGRTPGWSPPAAVVGPWRPVWLAQRSQANRVEAGRDTLLQARVQGQAGVVFCRLAQSLTGAVAQGEGVPVLQLERAGRVFRQTMVEALA